MAPLDGLAGLAGLETEPCVPREQSRPLLRRRLTVLVVEHPQSQRDRPQRLRISILPALDSRNLQERARLGDGVLARQPPDGPVRHLGRPEAPHAIPHVAQRFVDLGQLRAIEIAKSPSCVERPLVQRGGFHARVDGSRRVGGGARTSTHRGDGRRAGSAARATRRWPRGRHRPRRRSRRRPSCAVRAAAGTRVLRMRCRAPTRCRTARACRVRE